MIPYKHKDGYWVYGCGHTHKGLLILDSNVMTMLTYFEWDKSVGLSGDHTQCYSCYCKDLHTESMISQL